MGRLLMSPCCERISPYDHAAAEGNLKMFTFAENGKRSEQSMEKETALPKNIRQIGEVRGEEKICLEDYVMTCIHKKEQQEKDFLWRTQTGGGNRVCVYPGNPGTFQNMGAGILCGKTGETAHKIFSGLDGTGLLCDRGL